MTPSTTGLRVEFDQVNKISLIRFRGRLTDESLAVLYEASRRYSTATKAKIGIVDFSSVTEFALTAESSRHRAHQKPAAADPSIIVAPRHMDLVYFACFNSWESLQTYYWKSYTR
jgi:hypothetical protein